MLIGLSGFKGSGKDAAADTLVKHLGFKRIALADPVREVAYAINPYIYSPSTGGAYRLQELVDRRGWDRCKREFPEVRRLLQAIGTEAGRNVLYEDLWIDIAEKRHPEIEGRFFQELGQQDRIVITDVRLDNECQWILGEGGVIWWVDQPGLGGDDSHVTEAGIPRKYASVFIDNSGTLEDLRRNVLAALRDTH